MVLSSLIPTTEENFWCCHSLKKAVLERVQPFAYKLSINVLGFLRSNPTVENALDFDLFGLMGTHVTV
jgi:hypothetical protein